MNTTEPADTYRLAALESRFGLRVSARLSASTEHLPHDITERLRHARQVALGHRQSASSVLINGANHASGAAYDLSPAASLSLGGGDVGQVGGGDKRPSWWSSLAASVTLAVLLIGLGLIDHFHVQDQIAAAAEVDAALLADDLPPAAYRDPGFVEYLKSSRE